MKIKEITQFLEGIAPLNYQESYDNSGLIVGDEDTQVTSVLICLDSVEEVIEEAIENGCNLVIAHHPIIFSGLKKLNGKNHIERTIIKAIKNDIAIYAIHTNLDNIKGGVSSKIADLLDLRNQKILSPKRDLLRKLEVYVPKENAEEVQNALFESGAGAIADYKNCSFQSEGVGTFFPKEDKIISGGNFHGQSLAMSMDYLALSVSELGNISERRIYQLISGQRGLPEFLVAEPGLNSGMMIPQYTAASIVSQNKQFCTPASSDSIVSSNGQEDHVSMGANAATKLYKVVENMERILAIELMNAVQAIAFRKYKSSDFIENFIDSYRSEVDFLNKDRLLHTDIKKSVDFIYSLEIDEDLLL